MNTRRESVSRIPVLALLAFAVLVSAALAMRAPPVVTWLDVGSPGDESYTRFDFPPESNGNETFRWTSDHAELRIPVGRAGRYRLDLHNATVEPAGRVLRIRCGDQSYDIPLANVDADSTVPIECRTESSHIKTTFDVPTVRLPNGGRALGVSIRDVRVTALDSDDRLAFRAIASTTIFSTLAGAGFALATLQHGFRRLPSGVWLAGPVTLLVIWLVLIEAAPDVVLSTVSGPAGVVTLAAGVAAWLLFEQRCEHALVVGLLAALTVVVIPPPQASLMLEAPWTQTEINALQALPGLAAIAVLAAAAIGGRRSPWLASAGAAVGLVSIAMPAISSWTVRRWTHGIRGPAWIDEGSIAGAVYILCAFAISGLAILAVRSHRDRALLRVTLAAATVVAALLLWRIEIMKFNGDEQHYYVTARSLAVDGDLELLNNYLEPQFINSTYSPIGNLFPTRDASVTRYAASVPAGAGSWYLVPPLDEGWTVADDVVGLIAASDPAPAITGPDGGLVFPPPLQPASQHVILLEAPCEVGALAVGAPSGDAGVTLEVSVLNASGDALWRARHDALPSDGLVAIPPESGLCQGQGPWAIRVESGQAPIVAEAIDRHHGLLLAAGQPASSWLFAGLPRDRYGSVDVLSHLLIHNPSDEITLVAVRLIMPTDLTTSEISIGLQPGHSVIEPLPVFGAHAVAVQAITPVEISAALYGYVDGNRYRIPATQPAERFVTEIAANPDRDAGIWLTFVNPDGSPAQADVQDGVERETLEICGFCAVTRHFEAGADTRTVSVSGVDGAFIAPGVVAYEERTGSLHFDLGLPLLATPLAGFDAYWPVLFATALAGIALAPGLFLLLRASGVDERRAGTLVLIALALAPLSTYAVRFYTDIVTAALLVWALVLWDRASHSKWALAGTAAVAVILPLVHGRLTPPAIVLLGLSLLLAARGGSSHARDLMRRYLRELVGAAVAGAILLGFAMVVFRRYAVALGSRGIENFFSLDWAARNSVGMLLDRGSGVLPFAPWLIFALAAPRPLHRTQRAALLITLVYYGMLTLRSGGWQTFGSPLRYLLPVIPLTATLALPGMLRLWERKNRLVQAAIAASLAWSLIVTMLLHWRPLSGYIDRGGPSNNYLMDQALSWLPFPSPFEFMPAIEAQPGPAWSKPFGIAVLAMLTILTVWIARGVVRDATLKTRSLPLSVGSGEQDRA